MNRSLLVAVVAVLLTTLAALGDADAKRLGGARTLGTQRQSVAPPSSSGPAANPVMPAQPGAAAAKAAPATPPASGASRWLGPIAGIAAGLGLAALLSHFGLSEGFGSLLLVALLVFAGIFLFRMLMGRRDTARAPLHYAGVGARDGTRPDSENASAPLWSDAPKVEARATTADGAPVGVTRKPLPQGFDAHGFATEAKRQFVRLQGSYDTADRAALSAVMTSEMYAEIGRELETRGPHQPTEIVTLDADVLDVSTEGDKHWASVRFTGLVREDGEPQPKPIDEVWNLAKPVRGSSGWLLAGITQLA